jgi:hypothetical protein
MTLSIANFRFSIGRLHLGRSTIANRQFFQTCT